MNTDGEFMRASDAFAWSQETDPALRSTVVGVVWLDHAPDWPALRTAVDTASRLVPRLRQRVEQPPAWLAPPRWVIAEDFELSWHLRRVDVPAPHTTAAVLDLARLEASTGFDRMRPLWTFTLVDGLEHGRAALIMKVHHSLTDGVGAMRLGALLFDQDQALRTDRVPPAPTRRRPALPMAIAGHYARRGRALAAIAARALPAAVSGLRDPAETGREIVRTVRSVADVVAPVSDMFSPVMRGRGLDRDLELLSVELADLKRAARTVHGSVNDAFLAGVTGGLRRYHEQHDVSPEQLRMTLPISIREPDDPAASNRITLLRLPLPVALADPRARMRVIGRACRKARREPSLAFTDAIASGLNVLPGALVGAMLKRIDFLASDVRGPAEPVYLAGAKVTSYCAFGPTMGSAANLTLLSYAGTCHVGVNLDSAAVPDRTVFMACLRAGFAEVLALAGGEVTLPIRDEVYPCSREARVAEVALRLPDDLRSLIPN